MHLTPIPGGVTAAKGFLASGIHCGLKKNPEKKDLTLIYSPDKCSAASVYTQNKVAGAPIVVTKEHLKDNLAHAVLCNSGNANTCNADGIEVADKMCAAAAQALGIDAADVIVASTGVIGQKLDVGPILNGMPLLVESLSPDGNDDAAHGIMTTDLTMKVSAYSFEIGGKACAVGGIAKGSGMIHPNMATMLCFITTDVRISPAMLQKAVSEVAVDTFNMISVDGDTSTNDMLSVLANGAAGNAEITDAGADYENFKEALFAVCRDLAVAIAEDGEGATKLLECTVNGAPDKNLARAVAKSVITSSLLKAAMFGQDANWGRILCAVGYTQGDFDINKIDVALSSPAGSIDVCKDGAGLAFSEEKAAAVLKEKSIGIRIHMNSGDETATAWGCDLTYDYVKINGSYRS
jgi:glutamate N-acetyltransferase/amino-acid N-acetyltransferase